MGNPYAYNEFADESYSRILGVIGQWAHASIWESRVLATNLAWTSLQDQGRGVKRKML